MLRIRHAPGVVETFRDHRAAIEVFESTAKAGKPVTLTTADGRPMATARQGLVEWRDPVLAGSPAPVTPAPTWPTELDPAEPHRHPLAWPLIALLALGVFACMIGSVVG